MKAKLKSFEQLKNAGLVLDSDPEQGTYELTTRCVDQHREVISPNDKDYKMFGDNCYYEFEDLNDGSYNREEFDYYRDWLIFESDAEFFTKDDFEL